MFAEVLPSYLYCIQYSIMIMISLQKLAEVEKMNKFVLSIFVQFYERDGRKIETVRKTTSHLSNNSLSMVVPVHEGRSLRMRVKERDQINSK